VKNLLPLITIFLLQIQLAGPANGLNKMDNQIPIQRRPLLRENEIRLYDTVRRLIPSVAETLPSDDLIANLKTMTVNSVMPTDPVSAQGILIKLDEDSSFIADCRYLADLYQNWHKKESRHFIFFYQIDQEPTSSETAFWDQEFDRLARLFHNDIQNKIVFIIDPKEPYGRCFPPWGVLWGIRQKALGENPHELVHLMLFKYSDVPFFHEPLAFMYGTDLGDPNRIADSFGKYAQLVADSGYVTSADIFHFPQIIGLDKKAWASSFFFMQKVIEKYGIEKLLLFMRETPWSKNRDEFIGNFKTIFGNELEEFERGVVNAIKSS
jgi:hypothetical protein